MDNYAVKLLTSGYPLATVRKIILSGIRGYESKVKRREQSGTPLYRTAVESGNSRNRKKIMGKSTWFKGGGGKISNTGTPSGGYWKRGSKNDNTGTGPLRTRTVLFVENTPNGELSKRIREQLARMEGIMGYKMKVVERVGTQLKDLFSLTNVWGGTVCGRNNCTTCLQDCEEVPDCTRRSVVYESICKKCIPEASNPGPDPMYLCGGIC